VAVLAAAGAAAHVLAIALFVYYQPPKLGPILDYLRITAVPTFKFVRRRRRRGGRRVGR